MHPNMNMKKIIEFVLHLFTMNLEIDVIQHVKNVQIEIP